MIPNQLEGSDMSLNLVYKNSDPCSEESLGCQPVGEMAAESARLVPQGTQSIPPCRHGRTNWPRPRRHLRRRPGVAENVPSAFIVLTADKTPGTWPLLNETSLTVGEVGSEISRSPVDRSAEICRGAVCMN